ncbi:carbohydrate ABC transporter permease [Moorella sulfitireducens (nom. illeg.)]|uniref:carbohydrate ABC transporter permease n=1 Tax=Neomoorella sulfitireducens TaxID=2972948 RepID=UPI0021AC1D2C|nr:sugar ABC transporter permease [Moorella sulfitireducens]
MLKKKAWEPWVYLVPALLFYTIFMAYPLFGSLAMSMYKWSGLGPMTFVGLENFRRLFLQPPFNERFFNALWNNIEFFLLTMVLQNAAALLFAVLLSQKIRFSNFFRTVFFAPVTMSVLMVGFVWTLLLNPSWGVVNKLLTIMHLDFLAKPWLGDEAWALPAIAFVNAWQFIGLPIMMFLAGIQAIPEDIYEAARIDGCNEWSLFWRITLPQLVPVIGMVTILTLVGNFSSFEVIYAMEGTLAGPNYSTDVLGTLFYRTAFSSLSGAPPDMGLGAAIASVMFTIIAMAVMGWFWLEARRRSA